MDDASLVSDISTLLVSNEFLNESQRKTKKHLRFRLLIKKMHLKIVLKYIASIKRWMVQTLLYII